MREANTYFQGNQIAVAPDGTLYNVAANLFTGAGRNLNGVYVAVMRSRDPGLHWSAPRPARADPNGATVRPGRHFPIRAEDYLPDIAIDPTNGDMYVVWSDGLGTPINRVVMTITTRPSRSSRRATRGALFLGDYMGLETIEENDVINFSTSTSSDGADVHSIRANHPLASMHAKPGGPRGRPFAAHARRCA
jgi:hypothetical protein